MKGYKTIVFNIVTLAASLLATYGLDVTPETQADIATGIVSILGVGNMILRSVTTTPIGKGA